MNRIHLAVSTSSCPDLRATELAEAVFDCGGDGVELRVDKGHAWETDGVQSVVSTGLTVTAIASSRALGGGAGACSEKDVAVAVAAGSPLRCFLDARCDDDVEALRLASAQVAALQRALGDPAAVMVEAHPGYASLPAVGALCAATGAGAVIDTLALRRLGIALRRALTELRAATRVLHLKGFERAGRREWRHRPLMPSDLPTATALAFAPELASVAVETKAGSVWRDLRLLGEWMRRERP
jgi:hypothetical protein